MSTHLDDNKISELRKAEIERLRALPLFPSKRPDDEKGVLLSDRIKYYCQEYQLVHPFDEELLEPAGYKLTVGRNYSIRGEIGALNDGMKLEIRPHQVAVIETYETINMPDFLIGRWNLKVKLAYKGLLWVGAAQVDPGFQGHLCCPIYNLSTEKRSLDFREPLALIDFVTTTPYEEGKCKRFPRDRSMVVFQQYPALVSGIEKEVNDFKATIDQSRERTEEALTTTKEDSEQLFQNVQRRIDTFVTLIFTVVAILFAALAIIATKGSDQPPFVGASVWVAAIALFVALWAHIAGGPDRADAQSGRRYSRLLPGIVALVVMGVIVSASLVFDTYRAKVAARDVQQAKDQASQAMDAFNRERRNREAEIQELRQQINLLQQSQAKKK